MRPRSQPADAPLPCWAAGPTCPIPAPHTHLYRQIRERGAIVSEFAWGAQPERGAFPRRNRIISGLSLGVVIVEAPQKKRGADYGPTRTGSKPRGICRAWGCAFGSERGLPPAHQRRGEVGGGCGGRAGGIGYVGGPAPARRARARFAPRGRKRLWPCCRANPRHIDELAQDSALPPATLLDVLLRLELDGLVDQLAGKRFLRRAG